MKSVSFGLPSLLASFHRSLAGFLVCLTCSLEALAADPWEIARFEVVNVEPSGLADQNPSLGIVTMIARAMRSEAFDPDFPEFFTTVELRPETKAEIEAILATTAASFQAWGFPAPALEPIVTVSGGEQAYRVYLVAGREDIAGSYHGRSCETLLRGETVILLDADDVIPNGELTAYGIKIVVHELFHAVQYATNFIRGCERGAAGSWMTEGQANAVGWHLAGRFRPAELKSLMGQDSDRSSIWGHRNYSAMLPKTGYRHIPSYQTSSFWQFLAEFDATDGAVQVPPVAFPHRDFSYLASVLEAEPTLLDCVTQGDPCTRELGWADAQLRRTLRKPLNDLYTRFIAAYALYGMGRIDGTGQIDPRWLEGSFDGDCPHTKLEDTFDGFQETRVIPAFDIAAAQCWYLDIQGFEQEDVRVVMTASAADETDQLAVKQLSAALSDGSSLRQRGEITTSAPRTARWEFELPVDKPTLVVLTNMADEAGNTHIMRDLAVNIMVIKEYARMGSSSGPSEAAIDQALPIELDKFRGYVYPYGYRKVGDEYVGEVDEVEGLVEPCVVRFPLLTSTSTGDAVGFSMNLSGPLVPGKYDIADGKKHKAPGEVSGAFLGSFKLGAGNALTGGRNTEYLLNSGTIKIHSVNGGLVRGELRGNGVAGPTGMGKQPPNYPQLSVATEFSILVTAPMGEPYRDQPYACLDEERPDGDPEPPAPPSQEANSGVPVYGTPSPSDPEPTTEEGISIQATGLAGSRKWAFGEEDYTLAGGCTGLSPMNFGFASGAPHTDAWVYLSFTTEQVVESGETGTFNLSNLTWDQGVERPAKLPPDSPIRVPRRYEGTGSLRLARHDNSPSQRRLSGSIKGELVRRSTQEKVTVSAGFSIPMSCGVDLSELNN